MVVSSTLALYIGIIYLLKRGAFTFGELLKFPERVAVF